MPKSSRRARRRPGHTPARPLGLRMRRADLAADLALPLADRLEEFLDLDQRLAARRRFDRYVFATQLFQLLAPWTALSAPLGEGDLAGRLLLAALIDADEYSFPSYAFVAGGFDPEVSAAASGAAAASRAIAVAPLVEPAAERILVPDPPPDLHERLASLAGRLRAGQVDVREAVAAARLLHQWRTWLVLTGSSALSDPGSAAAADVLLAAHVLAPPATYEQDLLLAFPEILESVLSAARRPSGDLRQIEDPHVFFFALDLDLIEDLGIDEDEGDEGDQERDGAAAEEDEDLVSPFDPILGLIGRADRRLRFTDDPADAAEIALAVTLGLLRGAELGLLGEPASATGRRLRATVGFAMVEAQGLLGLQGAGSEDPTLAPADAAEVVPIAEQSIAVLTSELPAVEPPALSTEECVAALERIVHELSEEDEPQPFPTGLAMFDAAQEAALLALLLADAGANPAVSEPLAPVLGLLDPLALRAFPELLPPATEALTRYLTRLGAAGDVN